MKIPAHITVGDSVQWTNHPFRIDHRLYDSTAYTLTYEFRGPGNKITLTGVPDSTGWVTTLTPELSAGATVGQWYWQAYLTSDTERVTVGRGELLFLEDLSTITDLNYDGRSRAEKALAQAEAALADLHHSGRHTKRYTIGNRQMEYFTAAELIAAISYWKLEVQNEQRAKKIRDGLGDPSALFVRFR